MSREVFEEVGIKIEPADLKVVHVMHRKSNTEYIDFFLTPSVWRGVPEIREKDKSDKIGWFNVNDLPENLLPHVKYALSEIRLGNGFSEYAF